MKEESLGLNHWLSFAARCQTVSPRSSAVSSGHLRTAPPKSASGMPRCRWYHEAKAAPSPLLLKKTPPIPVIFAIVASFPPLRSEGYLDSYRIATAPEASSVEDWGKVLGDAAAIAAAIAAILDRPPHHGHVLECGPRPSRAGQARGATQTGEQGADLLAPEHDW